jgi:hypothetical protein
MGVCKTMTVTGPGFVGPVFPQATGNKTAERARKNIKSGMK